MNFLFFLMPLFFIISFFYSAVGLGGGSAYIAVLAISGISYTYIPVMALSLNLIASGSSWLGYKKSGHFRAALLFPLVIASVPAAFLGGLIHFSEKLFFILLGSVLFLAAIWIFLSTEIQSSQKPMPHFERWLIALGIGTALGFLAGVVGIGGGIFLGPVLLGMSWTNAKQTAAVTSGFIFLNSISGLLAHLTRQIPDLSIWLPLIGVVLLGGLLGSYTGSHLFSTKLVQRSLGVVLFFASIMIGAKIL